MRNDEKLKMDSRGNPGGLVESNREILAGYTREHLIRFCQDVTSGIQFGGLYLEPATTLKDLLV